MTTTFVRLYDCTMQLIQALQLAASVLFFVVACFCATKKGLQCSHGKYQPNLRALAHYEPPKWPAKNNDKDSSLDNPFRILYIVTSMREFDNGQRNTQRGFDRFNNTLLPVLRESAWSLREQGWVDVVLVTHYNVTQRHQDMLREALSQPPPSLSRKDFYRNHKDEIPFEIWSDATPWAYPIDDKTRQLKDRLAYHTRGLSRQHRFVLKDKWQYYDMFACFEDDMIIHVSQLEQYWNATQQLYQLRLKAPLAPDEPPTRQHQPNPLFRQRFYGNLTQSMLQRTVPGLFRVEAALPGWNRSKIKHYEDNLYPQIPINVEWEGESDASHLIDAKSCCHVAPETVNDHIPLAPRASDLYFWETSIDALGVRLMPDGTPLSSSKDSSSRSKLGWSLLLVGGLDESFLDPDSIPSYWVGRAGNPKYFPSKPDTRKGRYASNQGGWFATKRQLYEWHTENCERSFLPPFPNDKIPGEKQQHRRDRLNVVYWGPFEYDGLGFHSVEYWSGGQQLFGPVGCNLRRVIPLDPIQFSRSLLYHSSNNKQGQESVSHRFSSRNIVEFWGQLNAVRKEAEKDIPKQAKT